MAKLEHYLCKLRMTMWVWGACAVGILWAIFGIM